MTTYIPLADYTAPTTSKKILTPSLFDTTTGIYGVGLYPATCTTDGSGHVAYYGGSAIDSGGSGVSPIITTNLSSSTTINAGYNLSLTVAASGDTPLTFAWYKNGSLYWTDPAPISGHTSTLLETSRQLSDTGTTYYCHISNGTGTADSATNTLTVSLGSLAYRPTAGTGIVGFPLAVDTGTTPAIDYTTFTEQAISGVGVTQTYTFNTFGSGTATGRIWVRLNGTTQYVLPIEGGSNTFPAESSLAISYSSNLGTSYILNRSGNDSGTDPAAETPVYSGLLTNVDLSTLVVSLVATADRKGSGGELISASTIVDIYDIVFLTGIGLAPSFTTNLSNSSSIGTGDTLNLTVAADGDTPLTFQWYKNGSLFWTDPSPINGRISTLTETNRQVSNTGNTYYCKVSNTFSNITSIVNTLTVSAAGVMAYRPTTGTGISGFTNGGNAVDTGASTVVDSTTFSEYIAPATSLTYTRTFTTFGTGVVSGRLWLRLDATTSTMTSEDLSNTANSSIVISYTSNVGSATIHTSSAGNSLPVSATPLYSALLTNVDISTITVSFAIHPEKLGSTFETLATAEASIDALYDVVFITE